MEIDKYSALLKEACERVKRTKNLNVSFFRKYFYGVHKYSFENVYRVTLMIDGRFFVFYAEEGSFNFWGDIPWSGQSQFRPANFDDWPEDKKLMLTWCWAIYCYCKNYDDYRNPSPPPIEE